MDEDYIPSGASSNTTKEREPKDVNSKRKNRTKPQKDNAEGERQPKDVKSKRKNRTKPQQDNSEGSTQVNETIEDSNAENEPNEGSTDQNDEGSIEAAQDQEQDNQKSMSLEVKNLTVFDIFQFLFQSSFANTARNHTKVELHLVTTYRKLPVETNIPYSLLLMSTLTKP